MLYKAYHILLLAQFAIINTKHKTLLRFLILLWRIKQIYAPLRASQLLFLS